MIEPRIIPGEGPSTAKLFFCGESPGIQEHYQRRPFVPTAPAGKELARYMADELGLLRHEVYLTNLHKSFLANNRDPRPEEIAAHEHYLLDELQRVQPRIIVPLGRFSMRWFLGPGDWTMEQHEGFAFHVGEDVGASCTWVQPGTVIFPIRHPAAGLHQPAMAARVRMGFQRLRMFLDGKHDCHVPVDQFPNAGYWYTSAHWCEVPAESLSTLLRYSSNKEIWLDTEWCSDGSPWCVGISFGPGMGFVVLHDDSNTLKLLADFVARPDVTTVLHNAMGGDLRILRKLGIRPANVRDTMISSYVCGLHPQGLKPLAYRLCGAEQEDYADVIRVPSERMAKEFLERIISLNEKCEECDGAGREPSKRALKHYGVIDGDSSHILRLLEADGKLEVKGWTRVCAVCKGNGWVSSWPEREGRKRNVDSLVKAILKKESGWRDSWDKCVCRNMVEAELGPMPRADLSHVYAEDPERAIRYAGRDPDITGRVDAVLQKQIDAEGLREVHEIDQGAMPLFEHMQSNGMLVDLGHFEALRDEFAAEMEQFTLQASELAGTELNLGSPDQVAALLFDQWKVKAIKQTPTGDRGSVQEKILDAILEKVMADDWPKAFKGTASQDLCLRVRDLILLRKEYAECSKLLGTYCLNILSSVGKDGRLRDEFKLTRVPSGRPASQMLLLIPVRSERGKKIRQGFIAPEGMLLASFDYSQIELRCAAHLSRDERMLAVFNEGRDLHDETNQALFKGKDRKLSKNLNFGIMFGLSAFGLQLQLLRGGVSKAESECLAMIEGWFNAYSGVRRLVNETIAYGRREGFIRGMFGRIWHLANLRSPNKKIRTDAERKAGNFPMQDAAQGIMKKGMGRIWREEYPNMLKARMAVRPLLQVHDELLWETSERDYPALSVLVPAAMENVVRLRVPVKVDGNCGRNWRELK